MQHLSDQPSFAHQAYAVDIDGKETPIVADTILIRLASGEWRSRWIRSMRAIC